MPKLTYAVQEALVTLLLFDVDAAKAVRALVPPKCYDVYYREIADAALDYLDRYKKAPGEHALDLVTTLKERNAEAADAYDKLYWSMEQIKGGINKDYVLAQASSFSKQQRLKGAIQQSLAMLESEQQGCEDKAEGILSDAIKQRFDTFDAGIKLNNPEQALSFLKADEEEELFPTGVELLDRHGLRPSRGTMWMLMAASNRGKSWGLVSNGKCSLRNRKRVLHVTLEMSAEKVAQRYVQALFSVSKRDQLVKRCNFVRDELGRFSGFEEDEMKKRPYLADPAIRSFLTDKLSNLKNAPPLIIKGFPSGSIGVKDLEYYLDSLEASVGFIPDHLLLDYPDIMKQDAKNFRTSIGQTYVDVRGLAQDRNMALSVVTQSNRAGYDAKVIREKNTAEDISKINTCDTVISYNQTDEELRLGLARLFALKARDEEKHQTILITQAYAVGQFCLDCVAMTEAYWDHVKQAGNGESEDEDE
jgi:replicative DNA helicase